MKIKIMVVWLLLLSVHATATKLIDSLNHLGSSLGKYAKFEIGVASEELVPQNFYNPYDSSSVDMYAIFTAPSGKQYRRNAFWMVQYRRCDSSYYQKNRFLTVAIPVS